MLSASKQVCRNLLSHCSTVALHTASPYLNNEDAQRGGGVVLHYEEEHERTEVVQYDVRNNDSF